MHVAYLTTEDLAKDRVGGKLHFHAVATELRNLGHQVTVVCPQFASQRIPPLANIPVFSIRIPGKNALGILVFELVLLLSIPKLRWTDKVDVMLIRGAGPGWLMGLIMATMRCVGIAVVLECNGIVWEEFRQRGLSKLLVANVWWSAWQQSLTATEIIGVTQEIAETHGRLAGRAAERCHTVSNGTYPAELEFSEAERQTAKTELGLADDTWVVGFVGSFSPWHNIEAIVEAARMIQSQEMDDVCFLLIGDGELFDSIKQLKESQNLKNVVLTGAIVDRDFLRRHLAAFDVGLCVNRPMHGSPLKFFEYLACGIPVIAAGFPQILELCDREGVGLGLEKNGAREISNAILEMRSDRQRWKEVGRRNRELAIREYSWQSVAKKVESILRLAVGERSQ